MFYKRVLRQALRKLAKDNVGITFLKIPFFFSKEKKIPSLWQEEKICILSMCSMYIHWLGTHLMLEVNVGTHVHWITVWLNKGAHHPYIQPKIWIYIYIHKLCTFFNVDTHNL